LAAIILGIVATALWAGVEWWMSKPYFDPYVAVVLAREHIDFGIPAEFQKGFDSGMTNRGAFFLTKDGKKVRVRPMEDFGSEEEAQRIATELAADETCILVIGNSNSTVTAATLDVFLKSSNPPAYILPIATATNLIAKAKKGDFTAILRMVPDNASQAKQVQQLAQNLSSNPRVAIYGDQENPLYSEDLMRDVASRIREKGGAILVEEMIGPTSSIYNSLSIWERERPPDLIIYIGVGHHGLLLMDQLGALGIKAPIIFTDGSMVEAVIRNISRIPNKAFVLSPVGQEGEPSRFPTYEPIGADAYTLTKMLVESCENCNKANMRSVFDSVKSTNYLSNGRAGAYRFDALGNNIGMDYRVYEITGGKISLK
jgi:ABC-type branched-subunit amino acid transport system substrate-binding protein